MTTTKMALLFQEGETPLIKATKMRNIEIVELLLDKGAKVSAMDKVLQQTPPCQAMYLQRRHNVKRYVL